MANFISSPISCPKVELGTLNYVSNIAVIVVIPQFFCIVGLIVSEKHTLTDFI